MHFPTDINLLWDAIRIVIEQCAGLSQAHGLSDWRQAQYQTRQFKKQYRTIQQLKHSTSKDEATRQAKAQEVRAAFEVYLQLARGHLAQAVATREMLHASSKTEHQFSKLDVFMVHATRRC